MGYVTAKSFWGCGTILYGWRPASDGRHVVTRWITLICFPIFPLKSHIVGFMKDSRVASDHVFALFGYVRDALEGEATPSLCRRQVINTYLYAYLPWAVALCLGPVVPEFAAWIMASLILASWFFAAMMMRRAFRRRVRGECDLSEDLPFHDD